MTASMPVASVPADEYCGPGVFLLNPFVSSLVGRAISKRSQQMLKVKSESLQKSGCM